MKICCRDKNQTMKKLSFLFQNENYTLAVKIKKCKNEFQKQQIKNLYLSIKSYFLCNMCSWDR